MSYSKYDPNWLATKNMMQDFQYISDFVSLLKHYKMLHRANQDWIIYPKKNFKSHRTRELSKFYIPQRLDINKISQIKITKQDYIKFDSFDLEFSPQLLRKWQIKPYDRVIVYVNPKKHKIGFKFYLNRSYRHYKKTDLHNDSFLNAIKLNPGTFIGNKSNMCGYMIHVSGQIINLPILQYLFVQNNIDQKYYPYFDYIHNRWEVQL